MNHLCSDCRTLAYGSPMAPAHGSLLYRGSTTVSAPSHGVPGTHYTHYVCGACGTLWVRMVDRWGCDQGFRLGVDARNAINS